MQNYKVNIIEHGEAQIEIEAENEDEAEEKAREMYESGAIDLTTWPHVENGYVDFLVDHSEPIKIYIKN